MNQTDSNVDINIASVIHWHGVAPQSSFTYIAVSTRSKQNKTVWLERVSDADYQNVKP